MMIDTMSAIDAIREALTHDPLDRMSRMALADALEEDGDESGALFQRRIAGCLDPRAWRSMYWNFREYGCGAADAARYAKAMRIAEALDFNFWYENDADYEAAEGQAAFYVRLLWEGAVLASLGGIVSAHDEGHRRITEAELAWEALTQI